MSYLCNRQPQNLCGRQQRSFIYALAVVWLIWLGSAELDFKLHTQVLSASGSGCGLDSGLPYVCSSWGSGLRANSRLEEALLMVMAEMLESKTKCTNIFEVFVSCSLIFFWTKQVA